MSNIKTKRIGSQIAKELSNIIMNESADSLLKTITITGCDVNNDLSIAKVYFTSMSDLAKEELERELSQASGFLRTELANTIDLRHTPKLDFIFDESVEYGSHIEKILNNLKTKE